MKQKCFLLLMSLISISFLHTAYGIDLSYIEGPCENFSEELSFSFVDADLYGADLSNNDFRCIDFSNANLSHTNLHNTDLSNAILTDAVLEGAKVNEHTKITLPSGYHVKDGIITGFLRIRADLSSTSETLEEKLD